MRFVTIGGQAVIEGVMMRNGNDYAVAVRKPDQTIEVKKDQFIGLNARWHTKKIPIIRGVLSFIDSLVLGMSTLTYSASFFEDEEEAVKFIRKNNPGLSLSDDEINYIIDLMYDYYESRGFLEEKSEEEVEIADDD